MNTCRLKYLFVWLLLSGAVPAMALDGQIAPLLDPVLITGRVVDAQGRPVGGVEIAAVTGAMGPTLYSAHTHGNHIGESDWAATTGPDGAYVLAVPFEGIRYTVGARYGTGYSIQERSIIAAHDADALDLIAQPLEAIEPFGVLVYLPDGEPAADQLVTLVAEYGGRWSTLTDKAGYAHFDEVRASFIGQSVLLVERGGLVAPLTIVRRHDPDQPTEVTLGLPAAIEGRVVAGDTGQPIAGAKVVLAPTYVSGLSWRVQADAEGRFKQTGLPPGEYQYRAVSDSHADRPPRGPHWFERSVNAGPGQTAEASGFAMHPRATLRGRVVDLAGEPVAGAMVGYICHFGQLYDTTDAVFTDEQGRFELRPAPDRTIAVDRPLEAFHPTAGGATLRFKGTFEPGEVREGIELVLAGTAHVYGRVTDEAGEPLAGISCVYAGPGRRLVAVTDEQGRYDLGRVRLVKRGDAPPALAPLDVVPVRPSTGLIRVAGGHWRQAQIEDTGQRFFASHGSTPTIGKDGDAEHDITLVETRLLSFSGTAIDDEGVPIAKARVYLLPRRVSADNGADRNALEVFIKTTDAGNRWMTSGMLGGDIAEYRATGPDALRELVVTTTGRDGAWAMQCLESDAIRNGQVIRGQSEDQAGVQPLLSWVSVLVVSGETNETIEHRLYPPVQIDPGRGQYVVAEALDPE